MLRLLSEQQRSPSPQKGERLNIHVKFSVLVSFVFSTNSVCLDVNSVCKQLLLGFPLGKFCYRSALFCLVCVCFEGAWGKKLVKPI